MSDKSELAKYSAAELLNELKRRSGAVEGRKSLDDEFLIDEILDGIDSGTIHQAARDKQRVIYGVDGRLDLYELEQVLTNADAVVCLFRASDMVENGDGTSTLKTKPFVQRSGLPLCEDEPFRGQPLGAFCSGVLVAPDLVATAGHCVKENSVADIRFVFGFRMLNGSEPNNTIDNGDIYRGVELVDWKLAQGGADWALARLDRPVTGHTSVSIRREGRIEDGEGVYVIGHPVGLPAKYAPGAEVRDNDPGPFFVANLDTYGGNSGSPVFNRKTHHVEGLLVRGEADFVRVGNCVRSNVCPDTGCRGEDCTRTTEFSHLVPGE